MYEVPNYMKGAGGLQMIQTFQTKKFQTGVGGGGVKGTLALIQYNWVFFFFEGFPFSLPFPDIIDFPSSLKLYF